MDGAMNFSKTVLKHNVLLFLAQVTFELDPTLYDIVEFHTLRWKIPIWGRESYLGAGKSSIKVENCIVDDNGRVYGTMTRSIVYVNRQTRKPTPATKDIIPEKYQHMKMKREKIQSFTVPADGVFTRSFTTNFSDLDTNQHTNMAVYLRMCMDTAVIGTAFKKFANFPDDLRSYRLRSMSIKYLGESYQCETLTVKCWQDEALGDKLSFIVLKHNVPITECSFRFYITVSSKL